MGKSVEECWVELKSTINGLVNQYVPETTQQRRQVKRLPRKTRREMEDRNRLWRAYQAEPTTKMFEEYKVQRNKVCKLIRENTAEERLKFLRSCKNRPKKFYRHMRNLQTAKIQVQNLRKVDGSGTTKTDHDARKNSVNSLKGHSLRRTSFLILRHNRQLKILGKRYWLLSRRMKFRRGWPS